MALWPAKKEAEKTGPPAVPAPPAGREATGASDDLSIVAERLAEVGRLLGETNAQVVAYLAHRETETRGGQAGPEVSEKLDALGGKLDALAEKLDRLAAAPASAAGAGAAAGIDPALLGRLIDPLAQKLDQLDRGLQSLAAGPQGDGGAAATVQELRREAAAHHESLSAAFRQIRQQLEDGVRELAEYVRPAPADPNAATPAGAAEWQRAILGPRLAADPALDFQRQRLLSGVLDGDAGACALAGQLLVFQSSPPEKMAPLLKEIGEAFYRWQPKSQPGNNRMEEALVAWLEKTCDEAGIGNRIELVHPGERFDSSRHTADGRGVEITDVRGWIVLRDNGKVYTKATVAVR
jgi:hypothetical protein